MASVFAFASLTQISIKSYNDSISEEQKKIANEANGQPNFGLYSFERVSFIPFACFSSLFLFITFLKTKRFVFLLTFLSFSMFSYEFFLDCRALFFDEYLSKLTFLEQVSFVRANIFDYLTFLFVSIFFIWQISILFRVFNKPQQYKSFLP